MQTTIIIPFRNRYPLVIEALRSALNQSAREIVLVDDCSDEVPPLEFKRLLEDNRIVRVSGRGNGPGGARQLGLEVARGHFVCFLDSDDLLVRARISVEEFFLRQHQNYDAVLSDSIRISSNEISARFGTMEHSSSRRGHEDIQLLPRIVRKRIWPTLAPLWRRQFLLKIGSWLPLSSWEDWEYDCRCAFAGARIAQIPGIASIVRDDFSTTRLSSAWSKDPKKLEDAWRAVGSVIGIARVHGKLDAGVRQALFHRLYGLGVRAELAGRPSWGNELAWELDTLKICATWTRLFHLARRSRHALRILKLVHDRSHGMFGR